ncbi:MAG: GNAT family N-acetyltransferase [Pseudomonadota bacterium]
MIAPSPTLQIKTTRLLLRRIGDDDVDAHVDLTNDETLARNASRIPFPYRREDALMLLAEKSAGWKAGLEFAFGGFDEDRLIGHAGLRKLPAGWSLGYDVHRDWRGRGFAVELGRAVCAFGFRILGADELIAGCFVDNPASQTVLDRIGFRKTGTVDLTPSKGRGGSVECLNYVLNKEAFDSVGVTIAE